MKNVLLIIPHVSSRLSPSNPGGQLTAAQGLLEKLSQREVRYFVVNTLEPSFPPPGIGKKILKAIFRVVQSLYILGSNKASSVVLFSSTGVSLLDRLFVCFLARLFQKGSLLFLRETFSSDQLSWASNLFKIRLCWPTFFLVQGENAKI
jgi:hypothetical protein